MKQKELTETFMMISNCTQQYVSALRVNNININQPGNYSQIHLSQGG